MILNSIQPSVLPLFLKIYMPPNLYYVTRLFGLFIYKSVPDWNERNNINSFDE